MTIIHMDTEQVRMLADKMRITKGILEFGWRDQFVASRNLDWDGNSRDEFVEQVRFGGRTLYGILDKVIELIDRLEKEIIEWEEIAASFGIKYSAKKFGENVCLDLEVNSRVANTLLLFTTLPEGRDLINDAVAAGIMFVVIKDGVEVGWLGMPGGKRIPIRWESMEGATGFYDPNSDDERIGLNLDMQNDMHVYLHTLGHEMQHAIDFNSGQLNHNAIALMDGLSSDTVKDMSIGEVETVLENGLEEYVKSEINAHGRGYSIKPDPDYGDKIINDGNYTKQEKEFIIETRNYEEHYEQSLNQWLIETYGQDTKYRADVWVNIFGNVRVDLNQGISLIPQIL